MSAQALVVTKGSIAEVLYAKDSIVVCQACGVPLYRLTGSIYAGDKVGDSLAKYAPVTVADLQALTQRFDLEPGQRAAVKAMSLDAQRQHCQRIAVPEKDTIGANCPACQKPFAYEYIADDTGGASMFGDRAGHICLAVIPPFGRRVTR